MSLLYLLLLALPVVYIVSSFIFLRKPHWLRKRRRPAFIARNIAHRGGAGESLENSFLAFDKGLRNGVEMLEIDCHLTKDQQVVVHHDLTIDRTTGQDGYIRDITYADLPLINEHLQLYYDTSTIVTDDRTSSDAELLRIPLLKDVFERYPGVPINIDVKENSDALIRQISELIREHERESITYWGSFNHTVCQKLTVQNSHIVRFCSLSETARIVVAYWLGLLPFLPLTPGAFEIPIPGEVFSKSTTRLSWKYKALFYLAKRALNNRTMFIHLQRRGIPVYVWILNNDDEYRHAFETMSVTGVMSDYPTRLQSYLKSHEHEFLL